MRTFEAGVLAAALIAAIGAPLAAGSARAQEMQAAAGQVSSQTSPPDSSQDNSHLAADPAPSGASTCPGNPNALGTSRVLAVPFGDYTRLGRMQYPDSLPLADKEVVLTFDDGPLPPYSNQILDILAAECVKATYFMVGSMARAYPAVVRRVYEQGHTIGTHSDHHPSRMGSLPVERLRQEIDGGIADVGAALGDAKYLAPFFRIPGLERSEALESQLADRSLIVFSSDTVADDWHHAITPNQIIALAMRRLEARGKGILLLHDIHPKTVTALPGLLKALKDNGFRIVQAVPSASYLTAMAAKPKARVIASAAGEQLTIGEGMTGGPRQTAWPSAPPELTADIAPGDVVLPAPDASDFEPESGVTEASNDVKWPDQPAMIATDSERSERGKARGDTEVTGSTHRHTPRAVHAHRQARGRAQAQATSVMSRIKSVAALFSPSEPTH
jgi:peptidoglycan/xylan/chitin deacetylase (PgdA/CDA1 family)